MTLPTSIQDREYQKFEDIAPGETAVRVTGQNFSGSFSLSGLSIAGRYTEVTLDDTTWTALPAIPLTARNAISVQNESLFSIRINYDPLTVGWKGSLVTPGNERYYDARDTIVLYGKAAPGSGTITIGIEELS